MAAPAAARGRRGYFDPWPGYVDVLSTLLMVVIFVLMVFVIAQVFLSRALSGRDEALARLNQQVAELGDLLSLEKKTTAELRLNIADLSSQLQNSTAARDEMQQRLTVLLGERNSLAASLADANAQVAKAGDDKTSLEAQIARLLQTDQADKDALTTIRLQLDQANKTADENRAALLATQADADKAQKMADENKAALLAALADADKTKKTAADTEAALRSALALARDETDKANKATADQKAVLDQKLAELENAYKSIDADKAKVQALLVEIAALEKLRDDLANKLAASEDTAKKAAADNQAALDAARAEADKAYKTTADQKAALDQKLVELENAYKVIDADRAKVQAMLGDIAALESLRDDLSKRLMASDEAAKKTAADADQANNDLIEERKIADSARLQIELLNRQVLALRDQLSALSAALDASEAKAKDQGVQIADLGKRLNEALANKVAELASYRSEFFGRLKQVLGDRPDVQIVGDRFVFQSEVLFEQGSADIEDTGKQQLAQFAKTLLDIAQKIPPEIDWILRVDGHTDKRPINTYQFASNWELSSARAIAVVKFLESQGVAPNRLVAAGFAEFRPLDAGDDEIAYRRNRRIELKLDQR